MSTPAECRNWSVSEPVAQSQSKIERYHRSMKSIVKLDLYYSPSQLEQAIAFFVCYYNTQRYHESLDNVTPDDMYFGHYTAVTTQLETIKQQILQHRREQYLQAIPASGQNHRRSLSYSPPLLSDLL